ncbi:MAG: hypothetical protein AAFW46_09730 [Pseudomonadota bacterium]
MTGSFGLPTLAQTRALQANVTQTKRDLQTAQTEAVTGRAANIADELNGDIAKAQQLQKLIQDSFGYDSSIQFAKSELATAQLSLSNVTDGASTLAVSLKGAVEALDETTIEARSIEAENRLSAAFAQLNSSFGGRYLFSGETVTTPPLGDVSTLITDVNNIIVAGPDSATIIAALDTYFETPGAGFDAALYNGATDFAPSREISPGRRLGLEATAVDQGIKDVLRGLATIAIADSMTPGADRDAVLQDGADALLDGENSVITLQNRIGAIEEQLAIAETSNSAQRFTYEQNFNALLEKDEFEAATLMRNLETQLEASYLTASRIAGLSLVNYLR